eukprot:TRINITY_DN6424_c0_g3_i5.p1 TRINITY_DN6424_c0_g3~~TRINITY_DN6424_c0_g3_i5.p1  ORF type:complete len:277 (-),score=39.35 TRINITY_DN6424_c0_g3_i5:13-843(-)
MKCCNSLCTNSADSLPFACDKCKEQRYCSQICKNTDWNLGHRLMCEEVKLSKLKSAEESCPFIKFGIYLSSSEVDKLIVKSDNVYARYEPVREQGKLGKGSYGEVILMTDKATNQLVAMKIISKTGFTSAHMKEALRNEIEIHKHLVHGNIVRMLGHIEDGCNTYVVMEYANRGNLFQFIRRKGKLTEKDAFFFFTQTCSAIHFLHRQNLMHRDIKPENLLLTSKGELKLCDFGCCVRFDERKRTEFCGTVEYLSLIHICRCRRIERCRSRWSPYH